MSEEKLVTVKLQLYSWIASTVGEEDSSDSLVEKKIKAGSTLGDFFTGLAETFPRFRDFVYNSTDGSMNDEVVIIMNNKLVQFNSSRNTVINDQDIISLSPVLVGG
jgi:molybdopterin converting factor small subunit